MHFTVRGSDHGKFLCRQFHICQLWCRNNLHKPPPIIINQQLSCPSAHHRILPLLNHQCKVPHLLIKSSSIVLDVAVGPVADSDVADFSEREIFLSGICMDYIRKRNHNAVVLNHSFQNQTSITNSTSFPKYRHQIIMSIR